jgi:SAM-dependent methyltransferase/uncharacterized protein YbaR (Trm112 family)
MTDSLDRFLATLQCPDCGQGFTLELVEQRAPSVGAYGLLRCACFTYPLVSGIPIIGKRPVVVRSISDARVVADGPTPAQLVGQILSGEGQEGLLDLLAFPLCPWPLNRMAPARALSQREPLRSAGLAARRRALRRRLARPDRLTAEDWLAAIYLNTPAPFDPFNYFFFRFGQPRHLAALALLSVLPSRDKPVLDLACGYGHLLHYLTEGPARHPAIGLDQNFHQLWVAKHYVAPAAAYVCADAERPLPLRDAALSAVVCADAFHHFADKTYCLTEMRRGAAGGTVVLTGTGNRLVAPAEGQECTPEEYAGLLAPWPHCIRGERELLAAYLRKDGPDLAGPAIRPDAAQSKWLYAVASEDETLLRNHPPMADWPHAAGMPGLNPIYEVRHRADHTALTFRFPSPWYAFENDTMQAYHPAAASLGNEARRDLRRGRPRRSGRGADRAVRRARAARALRAAGRAAVDDEGQPNAHLPAASRRGRNGHTLAFFQAVAGSTSSPAA